jgi:hypothetical protein
MNIGFDMIVKITDTSAWWYRIDVEMIPQAKGVNRLDCYVVCLRDLDVVHNPTFSSLTLLVQAYANSGLACGVKLKRHLLDQPLMKTLDETLVEYG